MVSINPETVSAKDQSSENIPKTLPLNAEGESAPHQGKSGRKANITSRLRKVTASKDEVDGAVNPSSVPSNNDLVGAKASSTVTPSNIGHANRLKTPAMQTQSSSRISKKRVLDDAALASSDDELPKRISPPKKNKSSTSETNEDKASPDPVDNDMLSSDVEVVAVYNNSTNSHYKRGIEDTISVDNSSDCASGTESLIKLLKNAVIDTQRTIIIKKEPGTKESPAGDIDLSVSPLKLGIDTTIPMDTDNSDENLFLVSPVELKSRSSSKQATEQTDDIATKAQDKDEDLEIELPVITKKSEGKQKLTRILLSDGEFVDEEEATMLLKAIRESHHLAEHRKQHALGKSSSSIIRPTADTHSPDVPALEESTPMMGSNNSIPNIGLPTPTTPVRPVRRTFMDVAPPLKTTKILSNSATLLDDTMKFQVMKLPSQCEVTKSKDLQDPLLADSYLRLPNLKHGILRAWNTGMIAAPMDCVVFSEWALQCPTLDYDNAERAVLFEWHNNFINPSRISPCDVNILYMSEDHKRAILQCNQVTAICLSPILSRDSCILEPSPQGLRNKHLTGNFHHQEWERFCGFSCMVFDHRVMVAQIQDGCMSFGTMGMRADRESISPTKPPRNPTILSIQRKTKMKASSRNFKSNTRFRLVLDANDTIPVYDSRNYPFDFKGDLDWITETLPLYHGEILPNSFVVIAYTMAQYEKDKAFYLSTNILYAILFRTETADADDSGNQDY